MSKSIAVPQRSTRGRVRRTRAGSARATACRDRRSAGSSTGTDAVRVGGGGAGFRKAHLGFGFGFNREARGALGVRLDGREGASCGVAAAAAEEAKDLRRGSKRARTRAGRRWRAAPAGAVHRAIDGARPRASRRSASRSRLCRFRRPGRTAPAFDAARRARRVPRRRGRRRRSRRAANIARDSRPPRRARRAVTEGTGRKRANAPLAKILDVASEPQRHRRRRAEPAA